ncbi:MAG TPA: helix-turn-helix transcriptional regulator [Clostridiales bacterium]|nr:helix-turn-helix transcriptional regulator [Clostridiales bacterium]
MEISEQLHYCSASYFTKTFRELTSIPPVEYRESM